MCATVIVHIGIVVKVGGHDARATEHRSGGIVIARFNVTLRITDTVALPSLVAFWRTQLAISNCPGRNIQKTAVKRPARQYKKRHREDVYCVKR
jgi:hypothetical protein